MLSASNIPLPDSHDPSAPSEDHPTTVLLLPPFTLIQNVTPASIPSLMSNYIGNASTSTTILTPSPSLSTNLPSPEKPFPTSPSPHGAVILLCSQRTRDARCGQSAPLLRREFERHLRPLGLYRDMQDTRPGGVGIYFISHVGGHKYSANVMIYRRAGFGSGPARSRAQAANEAANGAANGEVKDVDGNGNEPTGDVGASQCIWLARVRPEDCEGIIKFTVLQGKVVKPNRQLRGGFDREKGLVSW